MKKLLLRSLLLFVLVYALLFLLISLPGPKRAFSAWYQSIANTFVPPVLSKAYLLFEQDPGYPGDANRVRVRLQRRQLVDQQLQQAKEKGQKTINLNFKTYNIFLFEFFVFPLLYFSALVIATPVYWKRKLWALLTGLTLLHLFMFFKTYFISLYHLERNQFAEYQMSAFSAGLIEKTQLAFNNITTALILATLIWGLTLFRKSDWSKLMARFGESSGQKKVPEKTR